MAVPYSAKPDAAQIHCSKMTAAAQDDAWECYNPPRKTGLSMSLPGRGPKILFKDRRKAAPESVSSYAIAQQTFFNVCLRAGHWKGAIMANKEQKGGNKEKRKKKKEKPKPVTPK
jgi:hypothetical protein